MSQTIEQTTETSTSQEILAQLTKAQGLHAKNLIAFEAARDKADELDRVASRSGNAVKVLFAQLQQAIRAEASR